MTAFKRARNAYDRVLKRDVVVIGWELIEWNDNEELVFKLSEDTEHSQFRFVDEVEFYRTPNN